MAMPRKRSRPITETHEVQQRRKKILELRLSGLSQAQIAAELGVHKSTVCVDIQKALAGITREKAEEYLELELQRLDAMFNAIWNQIVNPKSDEERAGQTWKIDRALAIMEQRAKLTGTYKAAELRAIAEAKGGLSAETSSMIGSFFGRLEELVAADRLAANQEDAETPDDSDDPDADE